MNERNDKETVKHSHNISRIDDARSFRALKAFIQVCICEEYFTQLYEATLKN